MANVFLFLLGFTSVKQYMRLLKQESAQNPIR